MRHGATSCAIDFIIMETPPLLAGIVDVPLPRDHVVHRGDAGSHLAGGTRYFRPNAGPLAQTASRTQRNWPVRVTPYRVPLLERHLRLRGRLLLQTGIVNQDVDAAELSLIRAPRTSASLEIWRGEQTTIAAASLISSTIACASRSLVDDNVGPGVGQGR